ncbi:glycerophosphodiester phosphodiesterase family protein [Streptosporangium sp. 'caverna']|uniref:glycerophosphodiester phosphodiesterase n=1 Tax=Streptosporangium sp. 'caverna' TaxID=2202249 RepID=UPI0013A6FE85|nr:glycerophosphodiester phosphodiesterase family protein [Streptosporangium sp. 'caverna']
MSAPGPLRRLSLAAACLAGVASLALVSLNPLAEEASATAAPALAGAPRSAVQSASTAASAREEVLINEDFGTRTTIPGGWTPKSGTWTVAGGALKQTSPKGTTMLTFGQHLDDFRIDATLSFDSAVNDSRWVGLGLDVNPAGTSPWSHAAVRRVSTASNGLEFANRLPSNSWSVVAASPAPRSVADGNPFDVSIEVHGTNATWTFEGRQIQTTQSLQRTGNGVLGLIMDQATASFRRITVTQLPPRPVIPLVEPGHTGLAIGHRGNPKAAPEDTLVSEVQSHRLGSAYMELDLHLTKDNVPVVMHDDTVDRTTNGTGRVDGLTLAQIKLLDAGVKFDPAYAGTKVPTFEEILQYAQRTGGSVMPELKAGWTKDQVRIVTALVQKYGLQSHTVWQSFDPVPLKYAYELDPSIARAGLVSGSLPADPVAYVGAFHGQALLPATALVTPALMRTMHAAGLAVVAWTADTPGDWAKLTTAGVDGIMSNSVGELIGWMSRYNQ